MADYDHSQLMRLDARIAVQKRIMDRNDAILSRPSVYVGPGVAGGSNYTMGKKLDAENERRGRVFSEYQAAKREYEHLVLRRELFIDAKVNYNGQPRADARVKVPAVRLPIASPEMVATRFPQAHRMTSQEWREKHRDYKGYHEADGYRWPSVMHLGGLSIVHIVKEAQNA